MQLARFHRLQSCYYRLEAACCCKCETKHFPPRKRCIQCGGTELRTIKLARRGHVAAVTSIHQPASGFQKGARMLAAVIDLDDGVRLIAQLTDVEPEDASVGMPVEMVVRRLRTDNENGPILYAYKFRPVLKHN
ncbi:MAG TPA: Zn-ribbon domain-containing OB-fold protein [Planctomycetota bacterium]|jgi:hypothetical protein